MRNKKRRQLAVTLYKKVYRIRRAEKEIIEYYGEDEMKTPMHMSMGEEAITTGVAAALEKGDFVFGYYRSHALYISLADETKKFFAEMYGKATGVVRGKGGSMHLVSPEHGLMGVSAVVASTIAPAVGAAFAQKMKKTKKIAVVFFGDGAIEEGVSLESLNAACLFKLPILFVCEDNGLAVDVVSEERQGFRSISDLVRSYRCKFIETESTDPEKIYMLAVEARNHIIRKGEPVFLRAKYYRFLQHIGTNSDFDKNTPPPKGGFEKVGYRSREEYEDWIQRDPVAIARKKLRTLGLAESAIQALERSIDSEVAISIEQAKGAPVPGEEELYHHVYSGVGSQVKKYDKKRK